MKGITTSHAVRALNSATANRVTTVSATTDELDCEANLTFDGSTLAVSGAITSTSTVTCSGVTIGSAVITEAELEVLDGATLSTTELNYVDGVSSAIQGQLDGKSPVAGHSSIATVGTIGTGTWQGTAVANSYVAALPTSKITSGTMDDARIAASNVTQHQASITGSGALNSGTITSGFGAIDTGSSTITTTGNLSAGDISATGGDIQYGNGQNATMTIAATAHNAAGKALTITSGTTTAGTTNNIAGGALTIQGGQGKGSGAGGDIVFQTANAGSSGSALNSAATALTISDDQSSTFAGAIQANSTVTVGANDAGHDVILYGNAASANVTWDASEDDLIVNGAARVVVPDGQLVLASTAISSTAAELNQLDALPRGSILIGDANAATARLAVGNANQVLSTDGSDVSWQDAGGGAATNDIDLLLHTQVFGS